MARDIPSGTPSKSSRHIFPAANRRMLFLSLAGGAALIGALGLLAALGQKNVLSPGDLAAAHAQINTQCALCHDEGRSMWKDLNDSDCDTVKMTGARLTTAGTIVRCERCHDPVVAGRLTNASHV